MKKMSRFLSLILLLVYSFSLQAANRGLELRKVNTPDSIVQGEYRALIIGNNRYNDAAGQWKPLNTAVSDADSVANMLQKEYGFTDVNILRDANRSEVLKALNELEARLNANDSVLVYYAGHGYLDESSSRGYWIPVDANSDDPASYLRNSTIRDEMSIIARKAKHTLLISDSCFSGSLLRRGGSPIVPKTTGSRYYKKVANKKSVQIMTAGGVEYVDDDFRRSGHSPFTYFLLNELKHNDKKMVTASEISSNVIKAVANNVSQLPESGVLQGAGDELGEFIFVRVKLDVDVKGVPREKIKVIVDVNNAEKITEHNPVPQSLDQNTDMSPRFMPLPTF